MSENIIADIIRKQEESLKVQAEQRKEWGLTQVRRLSQVIESDGGKVSEDLWNRFLFNINGLRINADGKVCYLSFYKPSKRILKAFSRHNKAIIENFSYITRTL